MESEDEDIKFSFAVVVRGNLKQINNLMEFLKESDIVIAHHQIGQNKMWIKEDGDHNVY